MAGALSKELSLPFGKGKGKGKGKIPKNQLPSKRSINLAIEEKKNVKVSIAVPAIILILLCTYLFSKYFVIDRFAKVAAAQQQVAALQTRLDAGYEELAGFDDLAEMYAHYTFSGMTQEELTRTDRVSVLTLIQTVVMPRAGVASWSLTANQLTMNMTSSTLQQINLIVQSLEEDPLVDYCTVSTAVSKEQQMNAYGNIVDDDTTVTALVVVYLNAGTEVDQ